LLSLARKFLNIAGDSVLIALIPVIVVVIVEHQSFAQAVANTSQLFLIPAFFFGFGVLIVLSRWGSGAWRVIRGRSETINFEAIADEVDVVGSIVRGLSVLLSLFLCMSVIVHRILDRI
jgi:hypothetical protein